MSLKGKRITHGGKDNNLLDDPNDSSAPMHVLTDERAAEAQAEIDRLNRTIAKRRDAGLNDDGTKKR
jgi:hypothetical protein